MKTATKKSIEMSTRVNGSSLDVYDQILKDLDSELHGKELPLPGRVFTIIVAINTWFVSPAVGVAIFCLVFRLSNDQYFAIWVSEFFSVSFCIFPLAYRYYREITIKKILIPLVLGILFLWPPSVLLRLEGVTSLTENNTYLFFLFVIFMITNWLIFIFVNAYRIWDDAKIYFQDVLPATFGRFPYSFQEKVYTLARMKTASLSDPEPIWEYLTNCASSALDSAEVRIIPWATGLALLTLDLKFQVWLLPLIQAQTAAWAPLVQNLTPESISYFVFLFQSSILIIGFLALFSMVRSASVNAAITRAVSRLRMEKHLSDNQKPTRPKIFGLF